MYLHNMVLIIQFPCKWMVMFMDISQHNNITFIQHLIISFIHIIRNTCINHHINNLFMELHILVYILTYMSFLIHIYYQFINNLIHILLYLHLMGIHIYILIFFLDHIILHIFIYYWLYNNYMYHYKHYHIMDKQMYHYTSLNKSCFKCIIKFHHNLNSFLHILVLM